MPSRNIVKLYLENSFYHVYNRGVDGRNIFKADADYKVFLSFVKRYLSLTIQNEVRPRWKQNLSDKLQLTAYCLMPNHFHFLLKQTLKDSITNFMRALMNSYVRYYNQKYKRVGGLFQSRFKAVMIEEEPYLLHLSRYIHLNPLDIEGIEKKDLETYYSSYGEYLGKRKTEWIHPEEILGLFGSKLNEKWSSIHSYRDFMEKYLENSAEILGEFTLE